MRFASSIRHVQSHGCQRDRSTGRLRHVNPPSTSRGYTMKKQQGFTLIELMIVVAIIAILAAIAIPQYQNYVARSQVTRTMGEAGQLKTVIEDCLNNGRLDIKAATTSTDCAPGATGSSILTGAAQDGTILPPNTGVPRVTPTKLVGNGNNYITATLGNSASAKVAGKKVEWTRNTDGSWSCLTDVDQKFAPSGCPNGKVNN